MALDINARRNLEITEKMRDKSKKGTLLWVLDKTSTSMGGRALRRWLNDPLIDTLEINRRLESVKELKDDVILRGDVIENLKKVYDIERLAGKMAYGNANARDMITLKNSLSKLPDLKKVLANVNSSMLKDLYENLDELQDIYELVDRSIVEDPPMTVKDGGIIKLGYNEEIDKLKTATTEGKNWIIQLEAEEREKTGIKNLKVGFNKVFGYFIEVTKSNLDQVPERFVRKQTLTNAERFITEDLKNLENQILGAEEKVVNLEYNAFVQIRDKIAKNVKRLQKSANIVSTLDVLTSFATVAEDMNYVKPELVVVAIALYFIGVCLKEVQTISDKYIPAILGVIGIVICGIYVVATCDLKGTQNIAMAIFTAIVQGILVAGLSNYVNQLIKQMNKDE